MKDPAVLFYFRDFLVGTEFMDDAEVGKYIRILCYQADKGALNECQLKKICKGEVPEIIKEKLLVDENGNYYQKRMQIEKEKRDKHCEKQKERIQNYWNKNKEDEYHGNTLIRYIPLTNANANTNTNEDINELYNKVVVFFDEDLRPKTDKQKFDWCDTLDKLVRIDNKTPDIITQVIKKTRMDDFWRKNFMSVMKLRQKDKNGTQYFLRFEKLFTGTNGSPKKEAFNIPINPHRQ